MVKITYIETDGEQCIVDARPGQSVMEAAVKNNVRGIAADCGGHCACATCRVYVDASWQARIGAICECEQSMLEFSADPEPGVRLSCQIKVTEELAGLVVRLPKKQHF